MCKSYVSNVQLVQSKIEGQAGTNTFYPARRWRLCSTLETKPSTGTKFQHLAMISPICTLPLLNVLLRARQKSFGVRWCCRAAPHTRVFAGENRDKLWIHPTTVRSTNVPLISQKTENSQPAAPTQAGQDQISRQADQMQSLTCR